ncbi:MAG: ATP-grasp domain-containing protein [Bdellovibrionaceae bacterium]|nr:ATP-grasp domain-containing protein [Bdellovibrio sp.]
MNPAVLLFGGRSEERLVSVASAQNLISHFDFAEAWFIYKNGAISKVSKSELLAHQNPFLAEFLPPEKPFAGQMAEALPQLTNKTVFLALHGTEGEDGTLQTVFEESQIAFTGSGSIASRRAFEKNQAKEIVRHAGLTVAPEIIFNSVNLQNENDLVRKFFEAHKKIVVKPLANGSSIGLYIISNLQDLEAASMAIVKENYGPYFAEKFIAGREFTVGVLQVGSELKPLVPSEIILQTNYAFDYQGKYLGRGNTEVTPAQVSLAEKNQLQQAALAAHRALDCYGYTRTDVMLTNSGEIVFIETNTLPGLTKASFIPQQLTVEGISTKSFIKSQLDLAQTR